MKMQIGDVEIENVLLPVIIKRRKKSINLMNSLGGVISYLSNYEEVFIEMNVKVFEYDRLILLKNYLTGSSNYRKNTFQIIPDSDVDLGNGLGITISVRYWSDEFVYTLDSAGGYSLTLLFRKEA
jgi:hypothetical protein